MVPWQPLKSRTTSLGGLARFRPIRLRADKTVRPATSRAPRPLLGFSIAVIAGGLLTERVDVDATGLWPASL